MPSCGSSWRSSSPLQGETQEARQRERIRESQRPLIEALNLNPVEGEALVELQVSMVSNITTQCRTDGRRMLSQAEYQTELDRLLGPVRREALGEYYAVLGARMSIEDVGRRLAATASPLTSDQVRRLEETMVTEDRKTRTQQAGRTAPAEPSARLRFEEDDIALAEQRNERILAAAQGYLDATQLEALNDLLEQQVTAGRTRNAMQRAQREAAAPK